MDGHVFLHARKAAGPVALATLLLLLVPLVAMQFSGEVDWTVGDFAAAGLLHFPAGLAGAVSLKVIRARWRRAVAMAGIAFVVLVVWAELAVGLFD